MAQRSEESGWAKWLMRGIAADDTDKDKEIRSCTEESMTRGFWWGLGATALAFVAVEGGVKYLNRWERLLESLSQRSALCLQGPRGAYRATESSEG
mmetsp:Transcript_25966/g.82740  ORF Transcript_25966/g.82740 Transcript_25966/m.82740 type:complete len:96 (-) Transcript_25966:306-593(-)